MRRALGIVLRFLIVLLVAGSLAYAALPSVPSGTWGAAGSMVQARSGAAAAVLYDGSLFLSGGTDASGNVLVSAESYESDGSFHSVAPMSAPRTGHTATFLADGYVLVTGGTTTGGAVLNSAELYDPVSDKWFPLPAMTDARTGHTATVLPEGDVLLAGGSNAAGALSSIEVFSLTQEHFSSGGFMSSPRKAHAAAALQDGRVLLVGGTNANAQTLASTDIYDPSTGNLSVGPSMTTPRSAATATTLLDGTVLLLGGTYPEGASSNGNIAELQSAEVFSPSSGTISGSSAVLHFPRAGHQAFLLPYNNQVLIVGGTFGGLDLQQAEIYTPWHSAFSDTGSLSAARSAFVGGALEPLVNGRLLVASGSSSGTSLASSEMYGFATIKTDQTDYLPGETVHITGSGWVPGETVTLTLVEVPAIDTHPTVTAVADANGNISSSTFSPDSADVNVRFYLTATGSASQAQTTFRDALHLLSVAVGAQTPSIVAPASSAQYTISFTTNGNGTASATLSITSTLPTGVTYSFSPNPASLTGTSTLTISTGSSTPAGSTSFTVQAVADSTQTATGTLNIGAATTTTVAVTSGGNPSIYGTAPIFRATVASTSGTPTGNVSFYDGGSCASPGTTIATNVALSGGTANASAAAAFSVGAHTIVACYAGASAAFAQSSGTLAQTVNPKVLTVTGLTVANKVYNATTTASLSGTAALLVAEALGTGTSSDGKPYTGQTVTLSGTASGVFASANAGSGVTVNISGLNLTGAQAGNYTLGTPTVAANITPKALTVTGLTGSNKIYDATTTATISGTSALQGAETPGSGTTADGKPYTGDAVSVGGTPSGIFASQNVGTGVSVTVSGLTLSGAQSGNYTATAQSGVTANITTKALTVTGLIAANKVYDATTTATVSGTAALQSAEAAGSGTTGDGKPYTGDAVSVSGTPAGTFASKNVATGIAVTLTGLTLSGAQASNYSISSLSLSANITAKALTVTGLSASNKVYDATLTATIGGTGALQSAEAPGSGTTADGKPYTGDSVSLGGTPTGSFATKDAGAAIAVSATGLTLSGTQSTNYSIPQQNLAANITAKPLTLTGLTANNKPYDGGTSATFSGTAAFATAEAPGAGGAADGKPYTGDAINVTGTPSGTFASAGAANGISVSVSGLSVAGAQSGDYSLSSLTLSANIIPANLTITANGDSKTYGQGKTYGAGSTAFTSSGLKNGDTIGSVTLSSSGSAATAAVGSYAIVPSAATGGTFNPSNYSISYANGTLTINAAALTITASSQSKTYGQVANLGTSAFTSNGLVNGDTIGSVTLSSAGSAATAAVGSYAIVPSAATGGTFNASNYSISYANGTLTVGQATLTIVAGNQTKVYGQTANLGNTTFSTSGLVNSDTVGSVTLASTGSVNTAPVSGSPYAIVPGAASGTGLANYTILYVNGQLTVTPASASIVLSNLSQNYDGTPKAVTVSTVATSYTISYTGIAPVSYGPTANPPTSAGSYTVVVTSTDSNYSGSASGTLYIVTAATRPVLSFSDIDSGPSTGGEGGTNGAFLCVYGMNFGSSRANSTIKVGGVEVARYIVWSDPGQPYYPGTTMAKACGQISAATPSGIQNVVLTTSQGSSTLGNFTVRAGNILWVTSSGSDSTGNGSQSGPWGSIAKCKNSMAAGDICVIGDGVTINTMENAEASLWLNSSGSAGMPKAIVAYPGANVRITATVASGAWASTGQLQGVNNLNAGNVCGASGCSYWTIAGFSEINGSNSGVTIVGGSNIRLVDNDVVCQGAYCEGAGAGLDASASNLRVYGNRFHDIGCTDDVNYSSSAHPCAWNTSSVTITTTGASFKLSAAANGLAEGDVLQVAGQLRRIVQCAADCIAGMTGGLLDLAFPTDITVPMTFQFRDFVPIKQFHNAYFGDTSNNIEFSWNNVDGSTGRACRGVLFNASGAALHDLHVHDNAIHDTACDGIAFSTVDPSQGTVEAYNNLIYNAGEGNGTAFNGGDTIPVPAYYACLNVPGVANLGFTPGTGEVLAYNNTLYNCGSRVVLHGAQGLTGGLAISPGNTPNLFLLASNNIIYADSAETYIQDYFGLSGSGFCHGSSAYCTAASSSNIYYGSTVSTVPAYLTTNNNAHLQPAFANAPADFRLFSAEPGTGTPNPNSAADLNGVTRNSSNPTPGSYEYISNAPTTARALVGTTTTLTSLYNPQVLYSRDVFTIRVQGASGAIVPRGQVAIYDGTTRLTQMSIDRNGYAYYLTSSLTAGSHSLHAAYFGDVNFTGSTSASVSQTIQQATATLSSTSLTFAAAIGGSSAPQSITLTNTGNAALPVSSITITSNEFAVSSDTCSGQTLNPNTGCSFSVVFSPTTVSSAKRGATLDLNFPYGATTATVALTGNILVPAYTLSPASITLSAPVNHASPPQTITLTNTSSAPLTVDTIAITTATPQFLVSNNTCVPGSAPNVIGIGQSCTFNVTFQPSAATLSQAGNLTVTVAPLAANKVETLTGKVTAPTYTLTPSSLTFSETFVGAKSVAQTVTVQNTSALADLTLNSILVPAGFSTAPGTCTFPVTLAAQTSCTLQVSFAPVSAGSKSAIFTLTPAAPAAIQKFTAGGTAISPITVTPAALSFGSVVRGTTKMLTVTVDNPANNPALTSLSVRISGSSFVRDSGNPGTCGTSLAGSTAATTCTVNVDYAPKTGEIKGVVDTGSLTITGSSSTLSQSRLLAIQGTAN